MTEREEQAITVLNTLYNNPLLSDIHRQALEVGIMAIKAASSSENPNKWIPCSERLPEVGQRVIATIESIDDNYVRETICGKYGLLCGNGIAWMPLPEPYQSEITTDSKGSDQE